MSKKIRLRVPKKISYAKAIREKCLECTCNQPNEVKYCTITDCALSLIVLVQVLKHISDVMKKISF